MSRRFKQRSDYNAVDTFHFVSPGSTPKEKLLRTRANMLENDRSTKINGIEIKKPPVKYIEKLEKEEHMAVH